MYPDIFHSKESDEFKLHSGCLRDPFKEETERGVSVILMELDLWKVWIMGQKMSNYREDSANHISYVI